MANDDDMRRLMKQLLPTLYSGIASYPLTPDSFVPSGPITKDLFENMKTVLTAKKSLILKRWGNYFAISSLKALSSHEMYIRYVMFACEIEIEFSKDLFDSLLNVCILVVTFITQTLEDTGVDFCDLSVDIFMEFYESNLKEPFCWCGGFERLAAYLRNEDLTGKGDFNDDFAVPVTYRDFLQKNACNIFERICEKTHLQPDYLTHDDVLKSVESHILATEVLIFKERKLPTLPSTGELMLRIRENRQRRAADSKGKTSGTDSERKMMRKNSKREEVLLSANITLAPVPNITGGDSKPEPTEIYLKHEPTKTYSKREPTETYSKPEPTETYPRPEPTETYPKPEPTETYSKPEPTETYSKPEPTERESGTVLHPSSNYQVCEVVEQQKNNSWVENIIRQVIKYNNSNCSFLTDANRQILKEAEEILEYLEDTLKSLIEILDEYDEE